MEPVTHTDDTDRGPWMEVVVAIEGVALGALVVGGSWIGTALRLVAVAALAVAAIRATRSSRRVRGTTAVAAGLVGLIAGLGIGVSHLARAGLSTRAAAGILCLVCGVALGVAGTVILVRRASGWHKLLALPIAFVVLQFVAVPVFAAVVVTNVPADDVGPATPADHGLAFEEVGFTTADGIPLAGWYVPSSNRAALVVLAGSGSTRADVLEQAAVLARHGYGTLIMDNRGHGRSGGTAMDLGWFGDLDVAAAVGFLQARPDVDPDRIGVVGMSMGGEEAIGAAATDPRVRAVVAEGATGRGAADHVTPPSGVEGWIERVTSLEQFALTDLLTDASPPPALRDAVAAAAPRPMLLIAGRGEEDANRRMHEAAPDATTVWELPDTPHVGALRTHPTEWEQRVTAFLDRALLAAPRSS